MAFDRETAVTPASIGDILIEIYDPEPSTGNPRRIWARIDVVMSDGHTRTREINLGPHLGAAAITQLTTLVETVRQKANDEMLPEGTA